MMGSPVFLMMKKKDQYDIVLIATMDLMFKHLLERNKDNRSRVDRYSRIHGMLMDLESRYEGSLPEAMGEKAEQFNNDINAGLALLFDKLEGV